MYLYNFNVQKIYITHIKFAIILDIKILLAPKSKTHINNKFNINVTNPVKKYLRTL